MTNVLTERERPPGFTASDRERAVRYRAAVERFDQWVHDNLDTADQGWGRPASADGLFSLGVYANFVGRWDWTHRALDVIQQRFIDGGELKQSANRDQMITYVPSWLAWAAFEAERFDLCTLLLDSVVAFQDDQSGGFFAGRQECESERGAIEFDSTTMSILALARAGRVAPAQKGAEFLLNLWDAQPAPHEQFYTAWSVPGGLATQEVTPVTVLRWSQPKQCYYKVGLYVQALANVYGVTGERKYLDAATEVYNCTISRAADLWTNTFSHKMCWAATTLYAITRQADYVDHACRQADHIVTTQQSDGAFTYPEIWPSYPPEPWDMIPNLGGQFALWLARTLRMLESIQERGVA